MDMSGLAHNIDSMEMPALRKFPSLAKFTRNSKLEFVNILDQFMSDDPGITVKGKYYKNKGDQSALMAINDYLNDNQNITQDFTKITGMQTEMEKQVDKLIG